MCGALMVAWYPGEEQEENQLPTMSDKYTNVLKCAHHMVSLELASHYSGKDLEALCPKAPITID